MVGAITAGKEKILMNCGAFGYTVEVLASILKEPEKEVGKLMQPGGDYRVIYERGKNMARYKIDEKLFDMGLSGDIDAIRQFLNTRENEQG